MKLFGFFSPTEVLEGPRVVFHINSPFHVHPLPVSETVVTTWFIMIVMILLFRWGTKKLELIPTKKQTVFEILYDLYLWISSSGLGKWKNHFLPYLGTLFTYLVVANTMSFWPVPGFYYSNGHLVIDSLFRTPTADINTTVGLASITTFVFIYYGFKTHGLGYLKEFIQPSFIMLPLNIVGEIAKPINISMRLFGNMLAGMVILGILYKFTQVVVGLPVIVAPLHLYFDIFGGIVQSLVFTMLTLSYIAISLGNAQPKEYEV